MEVRREFKRCLKLENDVIQIIADWPSWCERIITLAHTDT